MGLGKNIKRLRESHGMSQDALAKIAGVTDKAVSTWENEKNIPRMGVIQKIADYFNVNKSSIIEDSTIDSDTYRKVLAQIPFFDTPISAGTGSWASEGHEYTWQEFENIPIGADFALEVRGDSMMPIYNDSEIIFVKQNVIVESGQIGVFILNGEGYLKMLQGNRLISLNSQYEPIIINDADSFFPVGRVVGKTNK